MNEQIAPVTLEVQDVIVTTVINNQQPNVVIEQVTIDKYLANLKENTNVEES